MSSRTLALGALALCALFAIWRLAIGPASSADPARPGVEEQGAPVPPRPAPPLERGSPEGRADAVEPSGPTADEGERPSTAPAPAPTATSGTVLVGRVRVPAGFALERVTLAELVVHRGMFGPEAQRSALSLDDEGRFRHEVDLDFVGRSAPLFFAAVASGAGDEPRATFALPSQLEPGENDLGEAALVTAELLAAGRVVDQGGDGVPGARLSLRWYQRMTVPPGEDPARWLPEVGWLLDGLDGASDAEGRFELRGHAPAAALEVVAALDEYLPAQPVRIERGDADVEIVLQKGGGVGGTVLLAREIPRERVRIEVRMDGPVGGLLEGFRRESLAPDGSFLAAGLPRGAASVRVLAEREELVIAELQGIAVEPGRVTRDPRLDPLDLRDAASVIVLRVRDENGDPVAEPAARVAGGSLPGATRISWDGGDLLLIGLSRRVDVTVWAPGYRAVELVGVEGEREVRLSPGPGVRARVASAPPLREAERLYLMLELYDGAIPHQISLTEAPPGAEVRLPASHVGRHMVSLWLAAGTGGSGRVRVQSPAAARDVELDERDLPGVVELLLEEDALRTAREFIARF